MILEKPGWTSCCPNIVDLKEGGALLGGNAPPSFLPGMRRGKDLVTSPSALESHLKELTCGMRPYHPEHCTLMLFLVLLPDMFGPQYPFRPPAIIYQRPLIDVDLDCHQVGPRCDALDVHRFWTSLPQDL